MLQGVRQGEAIARPCGVLPPYTPTFLLTACQRSSRQRQCARGYAAWQNMHTFALTSHYTRGQPTHPLHPPSPFPCAPASHGLPTRSRRRPLPSRPPTHCCALISTLFSPPPPFPTRSVTPCAATPPRSWAPPSCPPCSPSSPQPSRQRPWRSTQVGGWGRGKRGEGSRNSPGVQGTGREVEHRLERAKLDARSSFATWHRLLLSFSCAAPCGLAPPCPPALSLPHMVDPRSSPITALPCLLCRHRSPCHVASPVPLPLTHRPGPRAHPSLRDGGPGAAHRHPAGRTAVHHRRRSAAAGWVSERAIGVPGQCLHGRESCSLHLVLGRQGTRARCNKGPSAAVQLQGSLVQGLRRAFKLFVT